MIEPDRPRLAGDATALRGPSPRAISILRASWASRRCSRPSWKRGSGGGPPPSLSCAAWASRSSLTVACSASVPGWPGGRIVLGRRRRAGLLAGLVHADRDPLLGVGKLSIHRGIPGASFHKIIMTFALLAAPGSASPHPLSSSRRASTSASRASAPNPPAPGGGGCGRPSSFISAISTPR